ncbi:MAG: DUF3667 domain-containing protein [Chitinophagales bacterium]|nr:DUF3667 domain-containing protein [Chitinophagales bacterium]
MNPTCSNCSAPLTGPYCAQCGQKDQKERLSLKIIFQSAIESLTNVERGFWYTMKQLSYRPGNVARDYLAGKRKLYYNPLRYLILIVAANAIIMVSTGYYDRQYEAMQYWQSSFLEGQSDTDQTASIDENIKKTARVREATKKYLNIIALLTLPFIGFVSYLGFRKRQYNYAEHLALNAFWNAQSALFSLFILLLSALSPYLLILSFGIILIINIIYYSIGYKQLFELSYGKALLKAVVTLIGGFFLFYVTILLLTSIGVVFYLLLFD